MSIIVLDAGHPSIENDRGAEHRDFVEYHFTLDVAREVAELVEHPTYLLRKSYGDVIGLSERAAMSNVIKPDYHISIHADKLKDTRACGMVGFAKPNDDPGRAMAESIIDAYDHHGQYVLNNRVYDRSGRPINAEHHPRVMNVLRKVEAPSCLIECGNMTNADDYRRLVHRKHVIAAKIAEGINRLCDT